VQTLPLKVSPEHLEESVRSRVYAKRLAAGGSSAEELVLHSAGVLGLAEDISSSALVAKAQALGLGTAGEWSAAQAAHRQALADVEAFRTILQQARLKRVEGWGSGGWRVRCMVEGRRGGADRWKGDSARLEGEQATASPDP